MAKSGRLMELGENIYGRFRSIFSHCDVFGHQSNRIRWKTQNKGYYAVQGHSRSSRSVYQSTARVRLPRLISDFLGCQLLLITNRNWQPISYRCGVIGTYIFKFWTLCVFEPPFGGAYRDNVRCSAYAMESAYRGILLSKTITAYRVICACIIHKNRLSIEINRRLLL